MLLRCFFLVVALSAFPLDAKLIKGGVGPGFSKGLHAKYLTYFAKQLETEIVLVEMPFQRRIIELKKGNLDILVGVREKDMIEGVHFLQPPYESLSYMIFTRKKFAAQLNKLEDLSSFIVGVSNHQQHSPEFDSAPYIKKISIQTVRQKLDLLMRKRIDAFIHFEQVTRKFINVRSLEYEVVATGIKLSKQHHFYVVISPNSWLYQHKKKIENMIFDAVKSGDIERIRQQHYLEMALPVL